MDMIVVCNRCGYTRNAAKGRDNHVEICEVCLGRRNTLISVPRNGTVIIMKESARPDKTIRP